MKRGVLAFVAVFGFLAFSGILLWSVAGAYAAAQERTRSFRYLAEALTPVAEQSASVTWHAPSQPLVREVTPSDQALLGKALAQAWRAFVAASDSGELDILSDYFSGVALKRAQLAARQAFDTGTRLIILEQAAKPMFNHLDGSILQAEAEALAVRFALREGKLAHYRIGREKVVTTLTKETTGWRVFSHERLQEWPISPEPRPDFTTQRMRGVNYYPSASPWRAFWPEFDPKVIGADLDRVVDLGGNSVRFFLPIKDFGSEADASENLHKLRVLLSLAEARGIMVIPTLFDLKPDYKPTFWTDDLAYLRRVLPVLASSPAVAVIDIKNQPDRDFEAHGDGLVQAWLVTMITLTREIAPRLPLTIGWSKATAAGLLADHLDAISYHDYASPDETAARLSDIRASSGGKPVLVTEVGFSSFSIAAGVPGSEAAQAAALADRLDQLADADGLLVWTLHDFEKPDPAAVGASPWAQRLQAEFGLFDPSGRPKIAAETVRNAFVQQRQTGN